MFEQFDHAPSTMLRRSRFQHGPDFIAGMALSILCGFNVIGLPLVSHFNAAWV